MVPLSLSKFLFLLFVLQLSFFAGASEPVRLLSSSQESNFLARFELHTLEEFKGFLEKASQASVDNHVEKPIAFILHGEEAKSLLLDNYFANKGLVDLAQKLSSQNVINVQVCETWMLLNGFKQNDFASFISTVPYAPSEIDRLIKEENYTYF